MSDERRAEEREGLAELGDAGEGLGIDQLDLTTIDGDKMLLGKGAEGADGVGGGHVGEGSHVFTGKVDAEGTAIFFKAIGLTKEEKGFGQTATDVLLGEVDRSLMSRAKMLG